MKRKILTIVLFVLAVLACAFTFVACGGSNEDNNTDSGNDLKPPIVDTDDGKLYKMYAGVYDCGYYKNEFIVFTEDKIWYDNAGATGKYKITDGSKVLIDMYADLTDNNIKYISGWFEGNKYLIFDTETFIKNDEKPIPECPKSLDYKLSEDGTFYRITGIGEVAGDVVVPNRYRFIPIEELSDRAFSNSKMLTSIEVPSTVKTIGMRVFEKCSNMTSAKIEAPVTELTEEFFGGCTKLTDVYIPKTVTEINYRTFKDCEKIQNVYYGGTAKDWAQIKFGISASHASSNMGSEEPYWANPISGEGRKLIINDSTVTSCELENVSSGAFFQYKYVTSVTARAVGDYAFYYSSITSLNASSVGKSACEGCHSLKSFSGGGTEIGYNAFFDCTAMTSASLSDELSEIGENAFSFCDRLTSITIPQSVIKIEKNAFAGNDMEEITFDDAMDWEIDKNVEGQTISQDLTNKTVAARLLTQRESNNGYCGYEWSKTPIVYVLNSNKSSFTIKTNMSFFDTVFEIPEMHDSKPVTTIGRIGGSNLTNITIPNSVTSIEAAAFSGCSSLMSIEIPNSVTSIGNRAFNDCTCLTIYCEAASKPSGWNRDWNYSNSPIVWDCKNNDKMENGYAIAVIDGIRYTLKDGEAKVARQPANITTAIIPSSVTYKNETYNVTSIDYAFKGCNNITSITLPFLDGELCKIFNLNNSAPSSLKTVVITGGDRIGNGWFYNCSSLTSIEIPNSVTSIGDEAFSGCSSLTSIEIPNSVTSIGSWAFFNCSSLTSIEIPNSVTSIGSNAFRGCSSLTSIEIPDSVTSIDSFAFSGCSSLTSVMIGNGVTIIGHYVFYNCRSLTNLTIGNNVTDIRHMAFEYCISLRRLLIPNSVTFIDFSAFSGCYSLNIIFQGTESQWEAVETISCAYNYVNIRPVIFSEVE